MMPGDIASQGMLGAGRHAAITAMFAVACTLLVACGGSDDSPGDPVADTRARLEVVDPIAGGITVDVLALSDLADPLAELAPVAAFDARLPGDLPGDGVSLVARIPRAEIPGLETPALFSLRLYTLDGNGQPAMLSEQGIELLPDEVVVTGVAHHLSPVVVAESGETIELTILEPRDEAYAVGDDVRLVVRVGLGEAARLWIGDPETAIRGTALAAGRVNESAGRVSLAGIGVNPDVGPKRLAIRRDECTQVGADAYSLTLPGWAEFTRGYREDFLDVDFRVTVTVPVECVADASPTDRGAGDGADVGTPSAGPADAPVRVVHLGALEATSEYLVNGGCCDLVFRARVVDANGEPVPGVVVRATVITPSFEVPWNSAPTDEEGNATFERFGVASFGVYTLRVDGVDGEGITYDAEASTLTEVDVAAERR